MQAQSRGFVLSTPGFTRNKLLIFSPESEVPRFLSSVLDFTRVGPAPPAGAPPPGMPAPAPRSFAIASSALLPFFIAPCHLARDGDIDLEEGWSQVSPLTFLLSGTALTRILDTLIDAGLFLMPVSTPDDLVASVDRARRNVATPVDGTAHPLALAPEDLDRVVDPFMSMPLLLMPPVNAGAGGVVVAGRGRGRGGVPPPPPPLPPVVGVAVLPDQALQPVHPSPLRWLSLVSIPALEDAGRARPLESLARILHVLGPCSTHEARHGEMSLVAAGAEALASGVRRQLGPGASTTSIDSAMAFLLRGHLAALFDAFPACYRRHAANAGQARERHIMECDFVFGRDTDRERIEVLCVDDISPTAPNLTVLIDRCPSQSERRSAIRSLAALYLGSAAAREPVHQLLPALEAEVVVRRHVYEHFLNGAGHSFSDVLMFLRERHLAETTAAPGGDRGLPGRLEGDSRLAADGGAPLTSSACKELTPAAIQAAVRLASFCATYSALQAMALDTDRSCMAALSICFRSTSTLVHRYLHFAELSLEARHPLFGLIRRARGSMGLYFGQAIVVRPGRAVPRALEFFAWGAAEESANDESRRAKQTLRFAGVCIQRTLFLQNKLSCMDLVNAPGGFLAVDAIRDGTEAAHISPDQHYRLFAAFEGFQSFIGAVYLACGYPRDSRDGHTWYTLIDVFLDYLKEGRSLTGPARTAHLDLCDVSFRTALRKIDEGTHRRLTESNPGEAPFSAILPFDSDGVIQLGQRLAIREEATAFRLALGIGLADVAPVTLEGSREARVGWARSEAAAPGASSDRSERGRRTERDGRDRRDRSDELRGGGERVRTVRGDSPHPGRRGESVSHSRSPSREPIRVKPAAPDALPGRLVTWDADGTAFIIGRPGPGTRRTRFDVKAISAHCGVPLASKCWPFLLSTKTGDARLTLCDGTGPDHVGTTGSAHVPPTGWDGDAVRANPAFSKSILTAGKRTPRGVGRSPSRSRSASAERATRG